MTLPPRTSIPQKTRESKVWSSSREEQFNWANGKISLCARLRPGDGDQLCLEVKDSRTVSLNHPELGEASYACDHTFGPEATQEQVYEQAVSPICEGVMHGYNGAVIAYGQTGSGKTYTMLGNANSRGVAPQAVSEIFRALSKRQSWKVEVTVLEIYNEKVRDLLAPSVTVVDIHEVCDKDSNGTSFDCPDATRRKVEAPEEALIALSEGIRRRETARTDMNHHSSRSHLVFTMSVVQGDPEVGATLNGRLHIVDLAGSERLKRSMASEYSGTSPPSSRVPRSSRSPRDSPLSITSRSPKASPKTSPRDTPLRDQRRESLKDLTKPTPRDSPVRDQRREAGEINKSLSQLALVIQRLTGPNGGSMKQVPYRDSMLTRLLAESFGGSSKTCLIITCSPLVVDREETRCSLEFGKRAKLVENNAEINVGMKDDVAPVMEALMQKEFARLHCVKETIVSERDHLVKERDVLQSQLAEAQRQRDNFMKERADLQSQLAEAQRLLAEAVAGAAQQHESHISDVKRFHEEDAAMRLRLEQTFAAVLAESKKLEDSKRERAAALEAEKCKLAERWEAKLERPSIVADNSHRYGSKSALCVADDVDSSTADASNTDSSDAEHGELAPFETHRM